MHTKLEEWIIDINILVVLIITPLFFTKNYFNIVESKTMVFVLVQLIFSLVLIAYYLIDKILCGIRNYSIIHSFG